jgi:hypothetical protein
MVQDPTKGIRLFYGDLESIHHAIRALNVAGERRLLVPEQSRFSERAGLADDDTQATDILVAAASAGNAIGMRVCLVDRSR